MRGERSKRSKKSERSERGANCKDRASDQLERWEKIVAKMVFASVDE